MVRSPFVHVDLDSKPDAGESVQAWLNGQPDLADVPRELTGGGAHLVFICRDLPAAVLKANTAPSSQLNDKVSAELFKDGLNLVLSPSVHKNGHRYHWEVTGEIPEVTWADLCRWFGFVTPERKRPDRPRKAPPWWAKWPEDFHTLDLVSALQELDRPVRLLDKSKAQWAVRRHPLPRALPEG